MGLERYVLRAYFTRVLEQGTLRLQELTRGRYAFRLSDDQGGTGNHTGLEIDVYDDQVGGTRSVQTLSGGESFIAALSLALALGEVIQEESGGIASMLCLWMRLWLAGSRQSDDGAGGAGIH